ncbi:MAG: phosphoenolpyruvate synthase, partial [Nanoarchaeota archaeon]
MSYIVWFKDLRKESIPIAGGKGSNIGEMITMHMPVPDGFAVTAQTYKEFIEKTGISSKIQQLLQGLDVENNDALQSIATAIQNLIVSTTMPGDMAEEIMYNYELLGSDKKKAGDLVEPKEVFVAVRSSATAEDLPQASFAGQQATFLNVRGREKVISAVVACWASLFTARAIYYRVKNGFEHEKVLISALVQKMVNAEKSGIMFTINPSTNHADEIVIEAIYGLGELIVGGEVNPDLYIVDKKDKTIKKMEIRKKEKALYRSDAGDNVQRLIPKDLQERQVLNEKQIQELARLGRKLEEHYGGPQDTEWAVEKGEVYIVQTRAVTTFKKHTQTERPSIADEAGKIILKGETASPGVYTGRVKVVHNVSELNKVQKGDIMVTVMTTPDMVPAMQRAGAIITNEGGMTCHAAIVSREMGTPCIVGTEHATDLLKDGELLTVHASRGLVYEGEVKTAEAVKPQETAQHSHTDIATATEIKVIMDLPDFASRAAATDADGVGLVRLEIMIANGGIHPAEYIRQGREDDYVSLLKDGIRKIAKAFMHKPVWIRCSDMRSDEYRNLQGGDKEPHESDPMIGWHGIRRLLDDQKILRAEFQAVKELHDEGFDNVGIMIPFIIMAEELHKAKEIMREVGLEPVKDIDFGVMIETPAACWVIEDICKEGISFISFG